MRADAFGFILEFASQYLDGETFLRLLMKTQTRGFHIYYTEFPSKNSHPNLELVILLAGIIQWVKPMKANVGSFDRVLRVVLGLAVIGWGVYAQSWWGLLGVPLLLSGLTGQCFLYRVFGISTCRVR